MNFDEEGLLNEPCLSCEKPYVEDIWHEWCCDEKECPYVKVPENHVVIDFDIPDENGNKSQGIHLPYSYSGDLIEDMNNTINEFIRQQREYKEKTLAEIITKYDFVVGSKECKCKLMEILPEGATIVCSPYIEDPTMIYAIKKFDIMDLLFDPQESEDI